MNERDDDENEEEEENRIFVPIQSNEVQTILCVCVLLKMMRIHRALTIKKKFFFLQQDT